MLFFIAPVSKTVAAPIVTSPAPGSTLAQSTQNFSWSANGTGGIVQWWLWIGNTGVGSNNVFSGSQGTNTSTTITGLPTDGNTINFRLWYRTGFWQFVDITYTACNGCTPSGTIVAMTSPIDGSTFSQPTQVFNWQLISGTVAQYWLYVGTTGVGSRNLVNANQGTNTQTTVNNLPSNGSTVYVRLWYFTSSWKFIDYTYTSCTGCVNSPLITIQKTSFVLSDGVNASDPKRIPGAIIEYTIKVTNSGFLATDNNSVVIDDTIPTNTEYVPSSLQFIDGTPSSGLAPGSLTFSTGNIQATPSGQFLAASVAGNPSFEIKFKVIVK